MSTRQSRSPTRLWWQIVTVVVGLSLLVFELAPAVDLGVSGWFYRPGAGFWLRNRWPLLAVYHGTRMMTTVLVIGLLGLLLWAFSSTQQRRARWRMPAAFALLSLALGPGLLAHAIKDHDGRARPASTAAFGGSKPYTPPWQPAANCDHNCSFVSAHAIAGFWFITGAWVWPQRSRRWWLAGIGLGAGIGLVRIIQGGHYLSDVLGAFALMWATNAALAAGFRACGWPVALRPAVDPAIVPGGPAPTESA